jgi:hypothetical protein
MTLYDAGMIFAYWRRHPPAGMLLQAIAIALGMKPPDEQASPAQNKYLTAEEFARLIAVTGGKLVV